MSAKAAKAETAETAKTSKALTNGGTTRMAAPKYVFSPWRSAASAWNRPRRRHLVKTTPRRLEILCHQLETQCCHFERRRLRPIGSEILPAIVRSTVTGAPNVIGTGAATVVLGTVLLFHFQNLLQLQPEPQQLQLQPQTLQLIPNLRLRQVVSSMVALEEDSLCASVCCSCEQTQTLSFSILRCLIQTPARAR